MSEDIALPSNTTIIEDQSNPTTKRRKRSGWDIQTPITDNTVPSNINILPVQQQTQPTQYNVAPLTAMQQAQQIGLVQQPNIITPSLGLGSLGVVPNLAGLIAQAPKLGCRIYIGYECIIWNTLYHIYIILYIFF